MKPEMQTSESDLKSKTQMSESDLKSETQASESDSKPATWGSGSDLKSETQGPESDSDGEELNRLCRRMRRDSALRLAAKIITDRNPLDYAAFLDRFDFAFLRRPSWWIRVSTGMHDLPGRLGSPENRARIARLGQATAVDQAPLPGQAPPVSQAVQPGQTTPVGQAAPPGQATAVGQTPQLGQATPASQTPPSVQPPAPPENRSGSLAPGMHSALHPGIHPALPSAYGTVVARSLIHNLGAYRLYAENEMMLISSLSAAAVSAGPAGHTARSAAPFTGISTAAIGPATVPAVPAIVPPTPGSAGPIPLSACRETPVLYSREQILEITGGSISRVLGERYAKADRYEKRARLPLPPFMFVDRVLALDATFGVLRPSRIETAYDIPRDSVLSMSDSAVSYVLMTESSQVAILLLSIAGIDLMGDEVLSYRILDSTTRFHGESPMKGDTLHSVLAFTDFQKSGETTLVSSRYACYNQGRLVLTQELTGGLFRESDLRVVKGMNMPRRSLDLSSLAAPGGGVSPRAVDLQGFYEGSCGPDMVVGRGHEKVERLHVDPGGRMVDRLTQVSFSGGAYGLGMIAAEKDLDADHWAFAVHFKNDPVFPGSLMAEAANQLQVIFAISAGYIRDKKVRLGFVNDAPVKISFRGQVMPEPSVLRYNWHVKSLRSRQGRTVLVSDCDVHWKDAHVVRIEDLTMVIEEVE